MKGKITENLNVWADWVPEANILKINVPFDLIQCQTFIAA
jgi:hypothetical protein